jgi:hypothetical protein
MALTRQFFQTPTGRPYQPARDIERSFDKTSMLIGGAMQRESDRLKQEEAAFGQLYNNIGELEGNLMQNYAGIEQQAIQSTRDFVKEHLKKGGRVSDPEFQLSLGERTGRIKAAMSNAERNREELKRVADMLLKDPHLKEEDRIRAFNDIYNDMNNPDVLISRNPYNAEAKIEKYINPVSVFEDLWKSLPTNGEVTDEFYNKKGDLMSRNLLMNPLIDRENPYDESGRPNIVLNDDFVSQVASGQAGQRALNQVNKIAQERYSDFPKDVAFRAGLKDALGAVAGLGMKETVKRSAADIRRQEEDDRFKREEAAARREERGLDREIKLAQLDAKKKGDETSSLYEEFVQGVSTGDKNYLSKLEMPNFVENIDWITRGDQKLMDYGVFDYNGWKKLEPEDRKEILKENNIPIPTGTLGFSASDKKEAFDALMEKIATEPNSTDRVGVRMDVKEGTSQGTSNFAPKTYIWGDDYTKLPAFFEQFDTVRRKVKGSNVPSPEPPKTIETKQGGASRFNPK